MIEKDAQIPYLLGRLHDEVGLEKTATIVDAIIGAPVGAVAARLSASEEKKDEATRRGLIVGALLGFLAGQKAIEDYRQGQQTPGYRTPIVASAAGGAAAGLSARAEEPVKALISQAISSRR